MCPTQLTARAFLSGLYPTCKDVVPIMEETQLLFEQGQDPTANCPVCSRAGKRHDVSGKLIPVRPC